MSDCMTVSGVKFRRTGEKWPKNISCLGIGFSRGDDNNSFGPYYFHKRSNETSLRLTPWGPNKNSFKESRWKASINVSYNKCWAEYSISTHMAYEDVYNTPEEALKNALVIMNKKIDSMFDMLKQHSIIMKNENE